MLFRWEEREALEEEESDNLIFETFKGTWQRVSANHKEFKLHYTECFYLTLYVIDKMKGKSLNKAKAYCLDDVWQELANYLCDELSYQTETEDLRYAVCVVLQSVAEIYLRANQPKYVSIVTALKQVILSKKDIDTTHFDGEFRRAFRAASIADKEAFAQAVNDYLTSDTLLSEEIEHYFIDSVECDKQPSAVAADQPSPVTIANRKKSTVIFALMALYRGGCFQTDLNRDQTIEEILHRAFDIEKKGNISQILNPIFNRAKKEDPEAIINKLVDQFKAELEKYVNIDKKGRNDD